MDRMPGCLKPAVVASLVLASAAGAFAAPPPQVPNATLAGLVGSFRATAKRLEATSGMREGFERLAATSGISTQKLRYADFVVVRLLFESTRDAGLWNLHWAITDRPPNSDNIWSQWQSVRQPAFT